MKLYIFQGAKRCVGVTLDSHHIKYERDNKMLNVKLKRDTGEKNEKKNISQKNVDWKYCLEIFKKDIWLEALVLNTSTFVHLYYKEIVRETGINATPRGCPACLQYGIGEVLERDCFLPSFHFPTFWPLLINICASYCVLGILLLIWYQTAFPPSVAYWGNTRLNFLKQFNQISTSTMSDPIKERKSRQEFIWP